MVKLVIFDMDGLMFDTENVTYRAFCEVVEALGYSPEKNQYVQLLGLNSNDIYKKYKQFYGEDVNAAQMYKKVGDRKMEILREEGIPVKKGLAGLLDAIEERDIKKAVASGSDRKVIEKNILDAGFEGRFDFLLSTKEAGRGKPFPDVFLKICNHFKVDPRETIVLEDSANGVEAALAGNIPVIQIPDMIALPEKLQSKCLAIADSLEDVAPYLDEE